MRSLRRAYRKLGGLHEQQQMMIIQSLEASDWLRPDEGLTNRNTKQWFVNPAIYHTFADRAEQEKARRAEVKQLIAEVTGNQ